MSKSAPSHTPKKSLAKTRPKKAGVKPVATAKRKQTVKKKPVAKKSLEKKKVALPTNMSQRAITKSLTYKAYFRKLTHTGVYASAFVCIVTGSIVSLYSSFNPEAAMQLASTCIAGECDPLVDEEKLDVNTDTSGSSNTSDYTDTSGSSDTSGTSDSSDSSDSSDTSDTSDTSDSSGSSDTSDTSDSSGSLDTSGSTPDDDPVDVTEDDVNTATEQYAVLTDDIEAGDPTLYIIEPPPSVLESDATFTIRVERAQSVDIIVSGDTGSKYDIGSYMTEVVPGTYKVRLPLRQFRSDRYVVVALVRSAFGLGIHSFPVGTFVVRGDAPTSNTEPEQNTTGDVDYSARVNEEDGTVSQFESYAIDDSTDFTSRIKIGFSSTNLSGFAAVTAVTQSPYPFLEFFTRRENATSPTFLGLAKKTTTGWTFSFNTNDLPDGKYDVFAQTEGSEGKRLQSNTTVVRISNYEPVYTEDTVSPVIRTSTLSDRAVAKAEAEADREAAIREFFETETYDFTPSISVADTSEQEAAGIVAKYKDELQVALERYSVAVQAGDETLIATARAEIRNIRESMMTEVIKDKDIKHLASSIGSQLDERVATLQTQVDVFETVRKERSGGATAVDTDEDGIADIDEINLYRTDPNEADSDQDGFLDGIEIMKGFDPNNAASEAVISYDSPKNSLATVRSDVLVVAEVIPLIQTDESLEQPEVQASITGTALPNAYVTLYIFSTPIIVTVKTDATGAYSYTLERELEDGSHEVYAAITDNTGSIVARSLPFSFVKEARAFTPVAAEAAETTAVAPVEVVTQRAYGTTIGLAVLAFGLLLLIVGFGMRAPKVVITETPT